MPSGGLHPPASPAATSGPGALSQRTDGKVPVMALAGGVKYGEQKSFQDIQGGAPLNGPMGAQPGAQAVPPPQAPTGFGAPTENPGEAVTAGANAGPGVDAGALNLPKAETPAEIRAKYGPILPALIAESQSQYATQAYKDSVTALLALF